MWQQDQSNHYSTPAYYSHPQQQQQQEPLQFYAQPQDYYASSRQSLDGQVQGSIAPQPGAYGGNIQQTGWLSAFGTGGMEGEPPLLEGMLLDCLSCSSPDSSAHPELGINFQHIRDKSLTVLNPLRRVDEHIMDDADLAGPVFFIFCFGISLLLVRPRSIHLC